MLIRDYKGKLVHFNIDKYSNEKDMYIDLKQFTDVDQINTFLQNLTDDDIRK